MNRNYGVDQLTDLVVYTMEYLEKLPFCLIVASISNKNSIFSRHPIESVGC